MKLQYIGKNIEVTNALREVADKKIRRLDKYFQKDVEGTITFSKQRANRIVEVTIFIKNAVLRAEESSDDIYVSIDQAIDTLESQIRKYKTKLQNRYSGGKTIRFENIVENIEVEEAPSPRIIRTKRFVLKPMDAEEAILQMELVGHNFYVFLDGETENVQVVYKRKDGNYGLIEPEV